MKNENLLAISKLALLILITVGSAIAVVVANDSRSAVPSPTRRPVAQVQPTAVALPATPTSQSSTVPARSPMPATPTPAPVLITVTLTNDNCEKMDYRVDGALVVSAIDGGATTIFQVAPGRHSVQACQAGTTECGEAINVNWTTAATAFIARGSCPITITLSNEHCGAEDLYVDGELVVISLAAGAKTTFQVTPGLHAVQACPVGTADCGETVTMDWKNPTRFSIEREPDCP